MNNNTLFQSVWETALDAMVLSDAQGNVVSVNPSYLALYKYQAHEVIGQDFTIIFPANQRESAQQAYQMVFATGQPIQGIESMIQCRDGTQRFVESRAAFVEHDGQRLMLSIIRDITERQLATKELEQHVALRTRELAETVQELLEEVSKRSLIEQELHHALSIQREVFDHANERLRHANLELERAARLKDEFLASMSHELRTPLNSILGRSEVLQEQLIGPLNERQQRAVQNIAESGQHLLSLINDILDVAKIEAGRVELDIGICSVQDICQACLRMVSENAQHKRIQTHIQLDQRVELIYADQRRLKQILLNLLSNAVKFTPEGGQIGLQVSADQETNFIHFTVWDTGIGIAEHDQQRLFQPFVQIDSSLARQYTGTGLGLSLIKRLTTLHNGSVSLESLLGQGSRFTVSLPWQKATRPARPKEPLLPHQELALAKPSSADSKQRLILLVDDNEETGKLLYDYLVIHGYNVTMATSGLQALAIAEAQHPDLISMDIQMPQMDGLETIRRLRANPATSHIPILALTALAMIGDRERCLNAGANDYMSKPISLKQFLQAVEHWVTQTNEQAV